MKFLKWFILLAVLIGIAGWLPLPIEVTVHEQDLRTDRLPPYPVKDVQATIADGVVHAEMVVTELGIPFQMDFALHVVDGKIKLQLKETAVVIVNLPQLLVDQISALLTPELEYEIDNRIRSQAGDSYTVRNIEVENGRLVIGLKIHIWEVLKGKL